ncbi:MAG: hypothetical protein II849_08580 [Bacteroidales bacterium]|nr:hypothetical protein [Bacteroidales bacterium]
MKKAILTLAVLCAVGMMAGCKSGAENQDAADTFAGSNTSNIDTVSQYKETEDIYVDGKQTEYVLIFRSNECWEKMLHDLENDSAALEGFYVAADDLMYYIYECSQKLQRMGGKYHETSADKTVFCQGDIAYVPQDSCDCGVLIVKPGCQFEFVDLMDFLYGQEYSEQ